MRIEKRTCPEPGTVRSTLQACFAILFGLVLFSSAHSLWAQSDRGVITGTVTDPSGAVITGASVTAINSATSVSTRTSTGSNGTYTIPLLPPGMYQVTAEHAGFKTYLHDRVVVEVGQTARLDVSLQLGNAKQSIEVKSALAQLRPDTSDLAGCGKSHKSAKMC